MSLKAIHLGYAEGRRDPAKIVLEWVEALEPNEKSGRIAEFVEAIKRDAVEGFKELAEEAGQGGQGVPVQLAKFQVSEDQQDLWVLFREVQGQAQVTGGQLELQITVSQDVRRVMELDAQVAAKTALEALEIPDLDGVEVEARADGYLLEVVLTMRLKLPGSEGTVEEAQA